MGLYNFQARFAPRILARRDGFDGFAEMMQYWDGKLPWYGHIFHWRRGPQR